MPQRPIAVVPPQPVATPHDLNHPPVGDPAAEADVPFWTPTWRDVAAHLGWRWVLFVPAVAIVVGVVVAVIALPWQWWARFGVVGVKLGVAVVAAAAAAVGVAIKSATSRRTEPFCIHCGYDLTGLPDGGRCPECGRTYSFAVIDEYRRDPRWFAQRYRQRGAVPTAAVAFAAGPVRRKRSRDGT